MQRPQCFVDSQQSSSSSFSGGTWRAASSTAFPCARLLMRNSPQSSTARSSLASPVTAEDTAPASEAIEKAPADSRDYRFVRLENGLEVMIVSDSEAETAAASVTINVGHLADPAELPGLAHLHEHMLFLGTEAYPEEGEYERFLNRHGGSSNAYTAMEETSYYFDVGSEHLDGALERFSHFFRAPLFTAEALDRELHAVDSEHTMHQAEDNWRMFQLLKSSANPKHPFAKFGSGCLTTLAPRPGVDTRALMIDFNRQHYVAPRMKLAVLGRESLDELEALVRGTFGHVRGGDPAPPPKPDVEAFGPDRLGTRILAGDAPTCNCCNCQFQSLLQSLMSLPCTLR
eukprot:TRINITY_DN6514_c0_g2_i2.p1 TRINITY_DN6514_c0_g2~~TRINITY_DN6514_c0_g2_i2.p1  ORF type:complete len:403 (-),score=64.92 TRINITY_DN6514_c0_g2_i2:5-1036(-)